MTKQNPADSLPPFHVLIPAAGSSNRMEGADIPKQYLKINGKSVLYHTIKKFLSLKGLKSLRVIIHPQHQEYYNDAIKGLDLPPPIIGSTSRKQSVYNGLKKFSETEQNDTLLIHDAARPLVQENDILTLLKAMASPAIQAVTLATPVTDTLFHNPKGTIDREDLWAIQTPQAFKIAALIAAHEKFKNDDSFTDDTGVMRAMGHEVKLIPTNHNNIKITTQQDFNMVQQLLSPHQDIRITTRTAIGFDVHAFETKKTDRALMLGGIKIKHDYALIGHSDADVILHATTDALLGSVNAGDIGTHFPPSDPQWKNADSKIFLQEAKKIISTQSATISFIDITLIAEEPKMTPYRTAIQNKIAEILDIPPTKISLKATTTEGLGFTGRKEGIACQAVISITLPMQDEL